MGEPCSSHGMALELRQVPSRLPTGVWGRSSALSASPNPLSQSPGSCTSLPSAVQSLLAAFPALISPLWRPLGAELAVQTGTDG